MEPASVLKANMMDNTWSLFRAVLLSMELIFDFNVCSSFLCRVWITPISQQLENLYPSVL